MGEVIRFNQVREKRENLFFETKPNKEIVSVCAACQSPIMIERLNKHCVRISFHTGLFTIPFVESVLRGMNYVEESVWQARKLDRDYSSPYAGYLIVLKGQTNNRTEEVLVTIIGRIIRGVYLEEICPWLDEVKIADLAKPSQHELGDGIVIDPKTKNALCSAGVESVMDLIDLTREEVCQISGMTTEAVFKLEKGLASIGVFLKPYVPVDA